MKMNQEWKQTILTTSQALADRGEYEQALACLNSIQVECAMASWVRGKIYMSLAEQMANDVIFKLYKSEEMKQKYKELLNQAHYYLSKAADQLPTESDEVRDNLRECLWNQLDKVQNAVNLFINRENVEEEKFEAYADDTSYVQLWADNLVEDISDWKLQ